MKILSSIFILICMSLVVAAQDVPKSTAPTDTPVPQQLRILPQPDAPLRIVSAEIRWATPSDRVAVHVYPVVENVSQKAVATFSTRWETNPVTGAKRCLGAPGRFPAKGLLPGEKTGTSTWQADAHFDPAPARVDFVEFTDGTRWGADECHNAESIDGARAGARAQRDEFLKIFRENGADALMKYIRDNYHNRIDEAAWKNGERSRLPISPPAGYSKTWEEGFTSGARSLIERVIEAEQKWGPDEIEHELSRPIGPSEKKSL
jgi:hypothetical protein